MSLSEGDQARVLALFRRLAETGRIVNREKFKKLGSMAAGGGSEIWEFKSFQVRFLGDFRRGGRFLVAHGIRKKEHNLRPADIEIAVRILKEHDSRKEGAE